MRQIYVLYLPETIRLMFQVIKLAEKKLSGSLVINYSKHETKESYSNG